MSRSGSPGHILSRLNEMEPVPVACETRSRLQTGRGTRKLENSMHKVIFPLMSAAVLAAAFVAEPAQAEPRGYYEVTGVEADDMLKMRAGPGANYKIIVGLPNGTVLWLHSCERSGSTSWCKISLKEVRGLRGYVSSAYLQKM